MRRPLRWELAPAERYGWCATTPIRWRSSATWAGGADVVAAEPVRVRSAPGPLADVFDPPLPCASPTAPSAAAGSGTWATARAARRSPRPGRAGCPRGGSAGTTTCWCGTGRRGSGSSRRCGRTPARRRSNAASPTWPPARPSRRRAGDYAFEPFRLTPGAAGHQEAVARAVEYIRAGDIFQANICLRAEAEFDGDPLDAFCQAAEELQPPYAAFIGVSAVPAAAPAPAVGASAGVTRRPGVDARRRGVALARAVPAPGRPHGHLQADQGHRPAGRRSGGGGRAAGRARAVGQEPVRERDDRGPGPQRPQPRLRPGHGHGPRPARRRAAPRRVAPGLDRRGDARRRRHRRRPAPRRLPARLGHRRAEGPRARDHRRARTGPPRGLHRRDRLPLPGRRPRAQRRHPHLRVRGGPVLARRGRRHRRRLRPRSRVRRVPHQGHPPAHRDRRPPRRQRPPAPEPAGPDALARLTPRPSAGVFTSLLVTDGQTRGLADHLARLASSVRDLYGKDLPAGLQADLAACLASAPTGRLRITVRPVGGPLQATIEVVPLQPAPAAARRPRSPSGRRPSRAASAGASGATGGCWPSWPPARA